MPTMTVVAGPPGGGKSTFLGTGYFTKRSTPYFNIDERCKQLHGTSRQIPQSVRQQANEELRGFCAEHLRAEQCFAFETTLRQDFAIRQARTAREAAFETEMLSIAAPVELHVKRVTARALSGGHAASEPRLREMYAASMNNLPAAIAEFDRCVVYDSTDDVRLIVAAESGRVITTNLPIPSWAHTALQDLLTR